MPFHCLQHYQQEQLSWRTWTLRSNQEPLPCGPLICTLPDGRASSGPHDAHRLETWTLPNQHPSRLPVEGYLDPTGTTACDHQREAPPRSRTCLPGPFLLKLQAQRSEQIVFSEKATGWRLIKGFTTVGQFLSGKHFFVWKTEGIQAVKTKL